MKKILLIEDDQIVANIYSNKFAHEGYKVEIASDGESGLTTAQAFAPDLIILDLVMPKMSGVDVMKHVRADPVMKDVPIIVFSNTYLTHMVQEAWKAGASKCLSKANCTPRQIIEVIRSVIGAASGARGAQASTLAAHAPPLRTVPVTPAAAGQPAQVDSDAVVQAGLRNTLRQSLPAMLAGMRSVLQTVTKSDGEARLKHLDDLCERVHALAGNAGVAGMLSIATMCDAFEALLKELAEKPQNINASTLRTVALAIDFLGRLFEQTAKADVHEVPKASILVVDDEAISRKAVVHALEKAKLKCTDVEDPVRAYEMLIQNRYDLVFLDVDMPGMNGFELCTKLRGLPAYKKTPVVFVTSLTDFESRASSMMSGGNDFIAKPFLFMELAVKALIYVFRSKLDVPTP